MELNVSEIAAELTELAETAAALHSQLRPYWERQRSLCVALIQTHASLPGHAGPCVSGLVMSLEARSARQGLFVELDRLNAEHKPIKDRMREVKIMQKILKKQLDYARSPGKLGRSVNRRVRRI